MSASVIVQILKQRITEVGFYREDRYMMKDTNRDNLQHNSLHALLQVNVTDGLCLLVLELHRDEKGA